MERYLCLINTLRDLIKLKFCDFCQKLSRSIANIFGVKLTIKTKIGLSFSNKQVEVRKLHSYIYRIKNETEATYSPFFLSSNRIKRINIRTEYGEIRSISPYSVRMCEIAGKMQTRITPNTDSFYAVRNFRVDTQIQVQFRACIQGDMFDE